MGLNTITNIIDFLKRYLPTIVFLIAIVTIFFLMIFLIYFCVYCCLVSKPSIVVGLDSSLDSSIDTGLDSSVVISLPIFAYTSESSSNDGDIPPMECVVCLSEFKENETYRLLPNCNHSFHIQCIDRWFQSNSTCPLCRSPVESTIETKKKSESECYEAGPGPSSSGDSSSFGKGIQLNF